MELLDRKLTYFLAVAGEGGLQKAGFKIGLTQAALTSAMHKLEKELGYKLFSRHRYGLKLTPEGEAFYHWLRVQNAGLRSSFHSAQARHNRVKPVVIGAGFHFLQEYLPNLNSDIYGDFEVQILSRNFLDLIRATEMGLIDFAFIGWDGPFRGPLVATRLFDCPCSVVGLKKKYKHIANYTARSELKDEKWIVEIDSSSDKWIDFASQQRGILVHQHHLFTKYIWAGRGVAEIEIHYFSPSQHRRLERSLIPSIFQDAWYGVVHRPSIAEDQLTLMKRLSEYVTNRFHQIWPGLRNGSPEDIKKSVERIIRQK